MKTGECERDSRREHDDNCSRHPSNVIKALRQQLNLHSAESARWHSLADELAVEWEKKGPWPRIADLRSERITYGHDYLQCMDCRAAGEYDPSVSTFQLKLTHTEHCIGVQIAALLARYHEIGGQK